MLLKVPLLKVPFGQVTVQRAGVLWLGEAQVAWWRPGG